MSYVVGRGSRARETYPVSPAVGSGHDSLNQAAWFIDGQNISGNASDSNAGDTALAPLLHHIEYRRRIELGPPNQDTTITLMSDLKADDIFDTLYEGGVFAVTYIGAVTVSATRTIQTFTGRNPATRAPNLLTTTAATTWSAFVGQGFFVRPQNGPAAGFFSPIAADLTANQARLGTFLDNVFAETNPVNGNIIDIVRITSIPAGVPSQINLDFAYENVRFEAIALPGGAGRFVSTQGIFGGINFSTCSFGGFDPAIALAFLYNCILDTAWSSQATIDFFGGLVLDPGNQDAVTFGGGAAQVFAGALFQGSQLSAAAGGIVIVDDAGFFDTVHNAMQVRSEGRMTVNTAWGLTGAGTPFGLALQDKSAKVGVVAGGIRTVTGNPGTKDVSLPVNGAITWAVANAGIKDGTVALTGATTSDAAIMPL